MGRPKACPYVCPKMVKKMCLGQSLRLPENGNKNAVGAGLASAPICVCPNLCLPENGEKNVFGSILASTRKW